MRRSTIIASTAALALLFPPPRATTTTRIHAFITTAPAYYGDAANAKSRRRSSQASWRLWAEKSHKKGGGDPLREATGIRPSLHPLTINTIAEALKLRAKNDPEIPLQIGVANVEPLQVALTASRIAAEAIQKRQESSEADGMSLTAEEQQTVAGRVLGVVMRLNELERELVERCQTAVWIAKYGEWDSFGILQNENVKTNDDEGVSERIKMDPLFTMNRAECVLALFLHQVEAPELATKNATVQDGSKVDFLDADRKDVLLES